MRVVAVLLFASILLSGCSGGNAGSNDDPVTPVVDPNAPAVPEAPEVLYTNRIWFGEAPDMSLAQPMEGEPSRTPMAVSGFGGGGGGQGPPPQSVWQFDLAGNGTITGGTLSVVIDVVEQLVNTPNPFPFGDGDCTWQAEISFLSGDDVITRAVSCVTETAPTIPVGEHELEFELDMSVNLVPGNTLEVELSRRPFSASPDEAVYVLSGSSDAPTWIEFTGLSEPLPSA